LTESAGGKFVLYTVSEKAQLIVKSIMVYQTTWCKWFSVEKPNTKLQPQYLAFKVAYITFSTV